MRLRSGGIDKIDIDLRAWRHSAECEFRASSKEFRAGKEKH
jgi:hypothetical protein